ncbi:hypothetical protein SAMN05660464_4201 [Geodermatophilus dictyosporus]|uniref:Uncharacterized protein n=1 Tax=Geodermatophilus dictyosporus TaxID=1523247 RepID=A0A1I5T2X2_9ACTN|nr:hypothetical protein SAMN05660464_4201 [Geodermatophilus dictyosporus]
MSGGIRGTCQHRRVGIDDVGTDDRTPGPGGPLVDPKTEE